MWWFIGGFVVGSFISGVVRFVIISHGTLRIDHSNPDKDVYQIAINNLDELDRKRRIILNVDHNADLSQN